MIELYISIYSIHYLRKDVYTVQYQYSFVIRIVFFPIIVMEDYTSISLYSGCYVSIQMVRKLTLECPKLTFFSFIQSEKILFKVLVKRFFFLTIFRNKGRLI